VDRGQGSKAVGEKKEADQQFRNKKRTYLFKNARRTLIDYKDRMTDKAYVTNENARQHTMIDGDAMIM